LPEVHRARRVDAPIVASRDGIARRRDEEKRQLAARLLRERADMQDRIVVKIEPPAGMNGERIDVRPAIARAVDVADRARAHDRDAAVVDVEADKMAKRPVDEILRPLDDKLVVVRAAAVA